MVKQMVEKRNTMPEIEKIKEQISYNEKTGEFIRIYHPKPHYQRYVGKQAGCISKSSGYIQLHVAGSLILAHRLAWYMMTNVDPAGHQIDHINGNRTDNRFCNLRLATRAENQHNKALQKNNTSGVKGVSISQNRSGNCFWYASVKVGEELFTKQFPFNDKGIKDAESWLVETRELAHGEYANHGLHKNEIEGK